MQTTKRGAQKGGSWESPLAPGQIELREMTGTGRPRPGRKPDAP